VSRNQSLEIAKDTIQIQIWRAVLKRKEGKRGKQAVDQDSGDDGISRIPPLSSGRFKITASEDKQGLVRNNGSEDMGVEFADWQ
jgi:hypothetical protein